MCINYFRFLTRRPMLNARRIENNTKLQQKMKANSHTSSVKDETA